ncbi:uncharacterized protein LOC132050256 isoform X2 [Lycium ferocissimum]|uniref:uncharacterized protein LOC132050256 isoform X2 n=1 Tax=Lycium ferocissimum TaxID=112874 RepID=UPI002814F19E|nr:uncharacterized protein LOC132050256 isoform X2 [Lycium ferocissimum]
MGELTVDGSLWWEPFTHLLAELESVSLSSDLPPTLEKKIKDNHAWFLDTISLFKPPNQKSREALDATRLKIGLHQITVETDKKEAAFKISSALCLDEVQSYILVHRTIIQNSIVSDGVFRELPHLVMLQYYLERQCLLKCTRQIIMQALYIATRSQDASIVDEAQKLISDGLDRKLFSVLQENLSSNFPENMDVDLYTLWAEEIVTEDNLILDVLFLIFYEFCPCTGELWKKFCSLYEGFVSNSYNFGKLAVSAEAVSSIYHAKLQLLLILIETLDLENLLQMVHDEIPFRQGYVTFSLSEVQEIDAIVSAFDVFENKESGPLILAWAVFLCLISSLPEKGENNILMEIDHIGYVRQAFEAGSLSSFLEIIENDRLKDFDGPIAGFRSVLRTFLSAFIASYEINLQLGDGNLKLILDILCNIYQGEESLCTQFWDRESFVDGPIRCLLCNLEGEFPFRSAELLQLLSALCEGAWPAECVFNFLDKSTGLSSPVDISSCSVVDDASQTVMVAQPLHLPGIEGLVIPSGTRGHLLKMIDRNIALVRWEFSQSGVFMLLLRLAQGLYLEKTNEIVMTLGLLSRLVTFNMGVCSALLDLRGYMHDEMNSPTEHLRVNVAEIICAWIKSLSPNCSGVALMSTGVNILAKMLKCSPYHVSRLIVQANIFDVTFKTNPFKIGSSGLSSGSWLLSGRLAKMLWIDCEQNDCQLTLSVLDLTMQLMDSGMENDVVLGLVIFSIQYVLVNHEFWNYKIKHARWKVTLKVLEVLKKCILSISYIQQLGEVVRDILLGDSSIHNALFRLVCTTSDGLEKLYFSRLYGLTEIEGLQQAIILVLDILSSMLSDLSRDVPSFTLFNQAIMSPTTKPVPLVTAATSLMSFFRNPKIQVGAARLLSRLFIIGDGLQSYALSNAYFGLDDKQICNFKNTICCILHQEKVESEDLVIATFKMLTSAARYQASFLTAVIALGENPISESCNGDNQPVNNDALQCNAANIFDSIWIYVKRSDDLVMIESRIMCNVLYLLKALWQGAAHYTNLLKQLRNSDFWKKLLNSVVLSIGKNSCQSESATELELQNLAYRYQCQHNVLDVVAYEMFQQKKILHSEMVTKESSKSLHNESDGSKVATAESSCNLKDIFGGWCESSLDAETIKTFVSFEYDDSVKLRARVAAGLFAVRVMCKVKDGDTGSLSVSLVDKVTNLLQKLRKLPAFSELMAIYAERGYSGGNELDDLILNDLFYHLQGELEGRQISHIPFKELSQYLLQSNFLQTYHHKHDEDIFPQTDGVCLYDTDRLQGDMAVDLWDLSDWKPSKAVAEMLLLSLQNVNVMLSLTRSKLSALIALTTALSISDNDNSLDNGARSGRKIPEKSLSSSIDNICQSLHRTIELLPPVSDASEDVVEILAAQAELLFRFTRSLSTHLSLSTCLLILKTSGYGLKVLSNCRPLVTGVISSMKIFLMLILFSLKSTWRDACLGVRTEIEHNEALPEAANVNLGLLPVICNCIELTEHCSISMIIIDQILKGFSTPATWFPIIQKHLPMQHIVLKLQDKNSYSNIDIILKFLLTIAHVKEGAEMLLNAGLFASLRVLLADLSDGRPLSVVERERNLENTFENNERAQPIWGLSLAVVTAIINSLGESSIFNVEHVVTYFLLEKADLISYYLSAPDFPSDDHDKKRLRALKPHPSLSALRESENTVMLICVLAKHRNAWSRAMKEMESQLRERCIHLLAFISCGTPRHGEPPGREPPIFCHPTLREEYEWHKKPSSINSKNGWFALSALCCGLNPKYSSFSSRTAIVIKAQPNEHANLTSQTHFSDAMSIQIYRITCLLLKFLCQQAEDAAERAEEVGFVDLAHFPELPMPDILHCLQDQGISIVTELCEANKLKQVTSEIQGVCILLLQITVMALYLEFCVIQICGMRPVHGRVEDFSREFHSLTKATEGYAFLKESMSSLKQMVSFVYTELLQAEDAL